MEFHDIWNDVVVLTEERETHLLDHPEMRGQVGKIGETLLEPDVAVQSIYDNTIRLFYRFYTRLHIGNKYLCVVVKYAKDNIFIITAYFTDKVKRGEVLWQK